MNLLEYFVGVMEKLGIMRVVCLVVVVQTWVRLASENLHIEHLVARILPKFIFLAQSWTYQLAFVPWHSIVTIPWGHSPYYFHCPIGNMHSCFGCCL